MKKTLLIFCFMAISAVTFAQNLQLHFDPRHALYGDVAPRNYMTATFEMFRPDKCGSTFMFIDMDFNQERSNIGLAYMEIARDFKFGKSPIMAHIEFNGGVGKGLDNNSGFTIESAYLAGVSYAVNIKGVNLSTYVAYKCHSFEKTSHDIQWTGVWSANLFNNKMTFSGFADVWTENKMRVSENFESGKKVVFLAEPQLWYNVNSKLSFGTEIEISNNFYSFYNNHVYVIPTIAAKWTF